jgi:hypothetical protein
MNAAQGPCGTQLVIPAYGDLESALIRGNLCGCISAAQLAATGAQNDVVLWPETWPRSRVRPTLEVIVTDTDSGLPLVHPPT